MGNTKYCLIRYVILPLLMGLVLSGCASSPSLRENADESAANYSGIVTGSASYRERIALLPGAIARVTLEDVGLADAPGKVIAQQTIRLERQVPIPFTLSYDPALIDPVHRYAIRVTIENAAGRLLWTTTEHYGVITQGNPGNVDVILHQVRISGAGGGNYVNFNSFCTSGCSTLRSVLMA
jgi:putative lipoprotein